jgi:hypothetical protein
MDSYNVGIEGSQKNIQWVTAIEVVVMISLAVYQLWHIKGVLDNRRMV